MDKSKPAAGQAAKRIGTYVRARRLALGLSRAQLAQRLGFVLGSVITHVERGSSQIAPQAVEGWALALELDPAAFAGDLGRLGHDSAHGTAKSRNDAALPRATWA